MVAVEGLTHLERHVNSAFRLLLGPAPPHCLPPHSHLSRSGFEKRFKGTTLATTRTPGPDHILGGGFAANRLQAKNTLRSGTRRAARMKPQELL